MRIEEIDKNFASKQVEIEGGKAIYTLPNEHFALYGVFFDEVNSRFTRMPKGVAEKVSVNVAALATNTAGGRICFSTNSSFSRLEASYQALCNMRHMPLTGSSGFSLFERTENGEKFVGLLAPYASNKQGFEDSLTLKGDKVRNYVLYFPLYNDVYTLKLTLEENAQVRPLRPYKDVAPILYYGSSITQGGCASRPDQAYMARIAQWNNIDFINLGFSGSAKAEEEMVDYLTGLNCSLFVCDYDHNAPSVEHLNNTHEKLYKRFRKSQPNTPILFVSRPDYKGGEDDARIAVIETTYKNAKGAGDKNVYFLSGKSFFGDKVSIHTVDSTHPTDYGFAKMAEGIYQALCQIDDAFKGEDND